MPSGAARGLSNKQIADALIISPKTAGRHTENIYTKIGVSNRARASLFAMASAHAAARARSSRYVWH